MEICSDGYQLNDQTGRLMFVLSIILAQLYNNPDLHVRRPETIEKKRTNSQTMIRSLAKSLFD
jgi:hypothetical protein